MSANLIMPDRIADNDNDNNNSDDEEAPFAISEDLVQSPTHKQASITRTDFDGLLQEPLLLSEDLAKGNGGQAWPAGHVLARYLLRRKLGDLRDASMLVELPNISPSVWSACCQAYFS